MRGFFVMLILALLPVKAWALTSDELDIGEHLRGPNVTVKEFTGKVVLIDLWGINCGPCIAAMPGLQDLHKKYKDAGLCIVALERQAPTKAEALEFFNSPLKFRGTDLKRADLEFEFTYAYRIPIPNRLTINLPGSYLFSADGILIGTDLHGPELEAKIQEATVESMVWLTNPGEIVVLADIDARLKSGQNMLATLSDLVRRKKESKDPKVIAEATRLFSAVFEWANKKYNRALAEKGENPVHSIQRLKTIARELKGTEIGDKAARAIDELRADERVVKHDKAEKKLKEIMIEISDLKPVNNRSDPDDPEFRRQNLQGLKTLQENCNQLLYLYPGTEAAGHVEYIVNEYHLKDLH